MIAHREAVELRVGVDIGGTFTDVCVADAAGALVAATKVLTTPADPAQGVLGGLRRALSEAQLDGAQVTRVVHATTLATNTILEGAGPPIGLLCTAGFGDTLEIARQHRHDMYNLFLRRPTPLVPRSLRREIAERLWADGTVAVPLDEAEVEAAVAALRDAGVAAVAICFLHAYANPAHERAAAQVVAQVAPALPVSCSSAVSGVIREYERMCTTTANAYVQPVMAPYLGRLRRGLREVAPQAGLLVTTSSGGVYGLETAVAFPIHLIESGPAAGILAAAADCRRLGLPGLLSFDMGGTTAKACLIERGVPRVTSEMEVARTDRFTRGSGLPLQVPSVDLIEIGAGGGSIARLDRMGRLQVGPESAGADPGPACYPGRSADAQARAAPTVTDADLVLGYLGADSFLGGQLRLDASAAVAAIERDVARPLGIAAHEAAWRIYRGVNEAMAAAARRHGAERGRDPAAWPLYAFGGAGPVHAAGVAALLGVRRWLVPPVAGIGSAVGLLATPPRVDLARSLFVRLDEPVDWGAVDHLYETMAEGAIATLAAASCPRDSVRLQRECAMRYVGQAHEVAVALSGAAGPTQAGGDARAAALLAAFEAAYTEQYGRTCPGVPVQVLHWRLIATGPAPTSVSTAALPRGEATPTGTRQAYFGDGGWCPTTVYWRADLPAATSVSGPVLIEERESTIVVPPGSQATVLPSGHIEVVM